MSEILSQSEIDELLSALMTGSSETDEKSGDASASLKVKDYDFRTANRFPKEQMRTFHVVFETYSQLLSNSLSSILRLSCETEILSIEECSYSEFNNSLPAPVVLAVMLAPPLHGTLLIQMSPEFAYMLISRLFGGGTTGENSKQFTEIELALVERVLRQQCAVFDEAWDKVISLSTQIDRIETSSQFAQITAPNEPVAVVIINITMGEDSGLMSICIPHTAIEPVAQQLNTRMWFSSDLRDDGKNEERLASLTGMLMHTPTPLTAYFGQTGATISDIMNLQIGDVIRLDHPVDEPLTIKVQHIPKFRATVGTFGQKYAMQIIDILQEEEEEAENESITR
ncbi:MAG: flagellar motor switch protein FliM [Oscillospiraceae bacterium]|nr:flagellar motor switch protein FliM [Oscillospiraceae bacterium]